MKTTHFAAFTAMQNARRLADSGAEISKAVDIIMVGAILVAFFALMWGIIKE